MGVGEQHEFEKTGSIMSEANVPLRDDRTVAVTQNPTPVASYPGAVFTDKTIMMSAPLQLHIRYEPMHEEFFNLIKQMCDTFLAKNSDYAGSDAADMMKNFMECHEYGIKMSDGITTRMSDKISRIKNLMRTRTQKVRDESLTDSVMDLANYCLLLTIALKREHAKLKVLTNDNVPDHFNTVSGETK